MNRPEFHFTPSAGWMNDPNGLVFDGSYYHLFYQYTPDSLEPNFLRMHWGHARSRDLLNWEHLPIALEPDEKGGVFSGSAVMDGERMVLIYTYHDKNHIESQAIATSADTAHTVFEKHMNNPVLPNPGLKDFRDPKVFLRDERGLWHMALACTDRVRFFTSPDLLSWTDIGSYGAPEHGVEGLWECPDLIRLDAPDGSMKWALIFSLGLPASAGGGKTMYVIGQYNNGAFTPDDPLARPVDKGQDFYAGVTFSGVPGDKKIIMAWMNNWCYAARTPHDGWRGMMSCPRELSLVQTWDGLRLSCTPIAPEASISHLPHESGEMLVVRDHLSVEMFIPCQGVSFSQTLY